MNVRADALAWAIARLPEPRAGGPPTWVIAVPEIQYSAFDVREWENLGPTMQMQQLVFRREQYATRYRRWFEWVLEIK